MWSRPHGGTRYRVDRRVWVSWDVCCYWGLSARCPARDARRFFYFAEVRLFFVRCDRACCRVGIVAAIACRQRDGYTMRLTALKLVVPLLIVAVASGRMVRITWDHNMRGYVSTSLRGGLFPLLRHPRARFCPRNNAANSACWGNSTPCLELTIRMIRSCVPESVRMNLLSGCRPRSRTPSAGN